MKFRLSYSEPYASDGRTYDEPPSVVWNDKQICFHAMSDEAAKEHVKKFLADKAIIWCGFEYQAHVKYLAEEFAPRLVQ